MSVIIPTYNRAKYIAETIESVLSQTYTNLEIIVIDDGSTDNTKEVVSKYVPRIQYVWKENSERGASRNYGLQLAKGEFISFLDSDDLWLPNKIEEDLNVFEKYPSASVVYSDVILIDSAGKYLKPLKRKSYSGRVTERLLQGNFIIMAAHLVRTELVRKFGGFIEERELSGSEDWEMWVRLSTITDFIYLPKVTAKYRSHAANTMSNAEGMSRSMNYALKIMSESNYLTKTQKKDLPKTQSHILLINAINYCSSKKSKKVISSLIDSFKYNPKIIADPRFAYTIFRLFFNGRTDIPNTF